MDIEDHGLVDVSENVIAGNGSEGVYAEYLATVIVSGNRIAGNGGDGVHLDGDAGPYAPRGIVRDNRIVRNGGDGVHTTNVWDLNAIIERNRTERNGDDGIDVDVGEFGSPITVRANRAFFNVDLGIEAAPGTIDGRRQPRQAQRRRAAVRQCRLPAAQETTRPGSSACARPSSRSLLGAGVGTRSSPSARPAFSPAHRPPGRAVEAELALRDLRSPPPCGRPRLLVRAPALCLECGDPAALRLAVLLGGLLAIRGPARRLPTLLLGLFLSSDRLLFSVLGAPLCLGPQAAGPRAFVRGQPPPFGVSHEFVVAQRSAGDAPQAVLRNGPGRSSHRNDSSPVPVRVANAASHGAAAA